MAARVNGNKISDLEKILGFIFSSFFFPPSYRSFTQWSIRRCWPKPISNLESIFWIKVMVWYIQKTKRYEIVLFRDEVALLHVFSSNALVFPLWKHVLFWNMPYLMMRTNSNLIRHKTYNFRSDKIFQLHMIKMRFISIATLRKSILGTYLKPSDNAKNCPEACGEPREVIKRICYCEGCFGQRRSHHTQLLPPAPAQEQRLCKSLWGSRGCPGGLQAASSAFCISVWNSAMRLPIALSWASEALHPSERL